MYFKTKLVSCFGEKREPVERERGEQRREEEEEEEEEEEDGDQASQGMELLGLLML